MIEAAAAIDTIDTIEATEAAEAIEAGGDTAASFDWSQVGRRKRGGGFCDLLT